LKKRFIVRVASLLMGCLLVAALVCPVPAASSGLLQITGYECSAGSHPPVGEPITWTITSSGGTGEVAYGFAVYWGTDIYDETYRGSETVGVQPFGSNRSYTYTPDREGIYFVHGYARDEAGTNRGVINRNEVFPPLQVLSIGTANAYGSVGSPVTWHASSQGGTGYPIRYGFWIYKDGVHTAGSEYLTSTYDASEFSFTYTPEEPGSYQAVIEVNAHTEHDYMTSEPILIDYPLEAVSLIPDKWRTNIGGTVTWMATTIGGRDVLYDFSLYRDGELYESGWYSPSNVYSARLGAQGAYTAVCHIIDHLDRLSLSSGDVHAGNYVLMPIGIRGVFADREQAGPGTEITWTVLPSGGSGDKSYAFELYKGEAFVFSLSDVPENTFSYTLDEVGSYRVRARVSDARGSAQAEGGQVEIRQELHGMFLENNLFDLVHATRTPAPPELRGEGRVTPAAAESTPVPQIVTRKPQKITPKPEPVTQAPDPIEIPEYYHEVTPAPALGIVDIVDLGTMVSPLAVNVKASVSDANVGMPVKATATARGGTGNYLYSFLLYKDGDAFGSSTVYSPGSTYGFVPAQPGVYKVRVIVKDGENKASDFTGNVKVK